LERLGYRIEGGLPPAGPLLAGVRHVVVEPHPLRRPAAPLREHAFWAEAAGRFVDLAASALASSSPPIRWPAGAGDARIAGPEDPEDGGPGRSWGEAVARRDASRLAGTALHAALETWDFRDAGRLRDLATAAARRRMSEEETAASGSSFGREVEGTAEEIVEELLRSPLPGRLAAVEVLGREVPILFRDQAG